MSLPEMKPLATMEEAWVERDRLVTEGWHLMAKGRLLMAKAESLMDEGNRRLGVGERVITRTAQALFGPDAAIDWVSREVKA